MDARKVGHCATWNSAAAREVGNLKSFRSLALALKPQRIRPCKPVHPTARSHVFLCRWSGSRLASPCAIAVERRTRVGAVPRGRWTTVGARANTGMAGWCDPAGGSYLDSRRVRVLRPSGGAVHQVRHPVAQRVLTEQAQRRPRRALRKEPQAGADGDRVDVEVHLVDEPVGQHRPHERRATADVQVAGLLGL